MRELDSLDSYLEYLCDGLGHADRHASLRDYCQALMLPIARKSVEPMAAHAAPLNVRAKHQSMHHFVANSTWSDVAVLDRIRRWVEPLLKIATGYFWIVDDTGLPKKGTHSVGVARQYCGQLGKKDNCQVAVTLSLASELGSTPLAYRLYLPKDWIDDPERRQKTGVPEDVEFATKPAIALTQISAALAAGVQPGIVLADAAYGDDTVFREGVRALGLLYAMAIRERTTVWTADLAPLPALPRIPGPGRTPSLLRRAPSHEPVAVKQLALELAPDQYRQVCWREGSNSPLSSRFAAVRVRAAHRDYWMSEQREEEWLLIEWPEEESEPLRYYLSNAPADATLDQLVFVTKMRWRIERDYQELKQEFGLGHYEGRGWTGFHHHATLCIATYGFVSAQRLAEPEVKKNSSPPEITTLPKDYVPRGRSARTTPRE